MVYKAFKEWLKNFQQQALACNERRLVVLVGDDFWANSLLKSVKIIADEQAIKARCHIYGDSVTILPTIAKPRVRDQLGSERDYVIFADSQFNIDALAALSGTVVAGGVFFLLINDYASATKSVFFQRFFRLVRGMPIHAIIEQTHFTLPAIKSDLNIEVRAANSQQTLSYNCVTKEQVGAVEAVIKVLKGKRKRPLVLTADRGRGKSSALALACASLLNSAQQNQQINIVITAGDINALQVFFKQLQQSLPAAVEQHHSVISPYGSVKFIAVDQLIKQPIKASIVLVDEAAAIPVYLLEQLVTKYHRMVFASTVHGYEGAGRGFTLKFKQRLDLLCPQWRHLHLNQPIRYRQNDPLERLIFDACLLNAELHDIAPIIAPNQLIFSYYTSQELLADEVLLAQIVSVLVTAHYQTKPSDVKLLLDNPKIQLVCLQDEAQPAQPVIAVAMLIHEGKVAQAAINRDEISAVKHSQRRLSNQFTPQSLLTQCGVEQAFDYHYLRVMRIAVHSQFQQQGIGQHFLTRIVQFAQQQGVDFISSSFAANADLLSFWLKQHFTIARLGFSRDKASGEHSALVIKAVNQNENFVQGLRREFYRSVDYLLTEQYKFIAPALVAVILGRAPVASLSPLSHHDKAAINAFVNGDRQYACSAFSLFLALKHSLANGQVKADDDIEVLIKRLIQQHSIDDICQQHDFTGKKAVEQWLRDKVKALGLYK